MVYFENPAKMELSTHHRIGTFIFWVAQNLGGVTTLALILFTGGTVVGELIEKLIIVNGDSSFFFSTPITRNGS